MYYFGLIPAQVIKLTSANDLVTMLWEDDLLTQSSTTVVLWKRLLECKNVCDYQGSLYDCLKSMHAALFPNAKRLLTVACILSIQACEAGRHNGVVCSSS